MNTNIWVRDTEQCPGINRNFALLTLIFPVTPLNFSSVGTTLNIHDSGHKHQEVTSDSSLFLLCVQRLFMSLGIYEWHVFWHWTLCSWYHKFPVFHTEARNYSIMKAWASAKALSSARFIIYYYCSSPLIICWNAATHNCKNSGCNQSCRMWGVCLKLHVICNIIYILLIDDIIYIIIQNTLRNYSLVITV